MPQTRAQARTANSKDVSGESHVGNPTKPTIKKVSKDKEKDNPKKRKDYSADPLAKGEKSPQSTKKVKAAQPHATPPNDTKETASSKGFTSKNSDKPSKSSITNLLDQYGSFPLAQVGLDDPDSPSSPTILAHVLNALLTSTRISHDLASRALKTLIGANYHEINTLKSSTWNDRCAILTEGGYARYREKTATELADLAALITEKYDSDAANFVADLPQDDVEEAQKIVRGRVKEVKGIGGLGAELFLNSVQGVVKSLAPFVDARSGEAAKKMGLGESKDMFESVRRDNREMARLVSAITEVRLQGKTEEFKL
jgi:hypothetical protein